jgi:hypothetical protein
VNADNLEGETWAGAPDDGSSSATISTAGTDYNLGTATLSKDGLHLLIGVGHIVFDTNDLGAQFQVKLESNELERPTLEALTSGKRLPFTVIGWYTGTATDTISLEVYKDTGSGSSTAEGNLTAIWWAP